MPMFRRVNKDFFKKWTSEMSYVLGLLFADGYITHNKRGAYFMCIQIKDKLLIENIRRVLESDHKISKRYSYNNDGTKRYLIYRLQIGSKEMCDDLREYGICEKKTMRLVFPNIPPSFLPDFVRGYFDGDGNVWYGYAHKERKNQSIVIMTTFTSCSVGFLADMEERLRECGVGKGAIRKSRGNYYRLVYSVKGSLKLYNFMYNTKLYTSDMLFLARKKAVFDEYLKVKRMQP